MLRRRWPRRGKNEKRYLAGALNARRGQLTWVEWPKKNSEIFLRLLAKLRRSYRRAKTIRLIVDNYVIHKSTITACFLRHNPKFKLIFQPVYHPWVNRIERLWKQLHDKVTKNHTCATLNELMHRVRAFLNKVALFLAAAHQPSGWKMDRRKEQLFSARFIFLSG